MPLPRGVRLGAYEIVEQLGAGASGEVYRGRDTRLGRSVAIKVLNPGALGDPAAVRRLETEARAASSLNHPGIITILETGRNDGQFYIVMELLDGVTLRHLLRRGPPGLKMALHIAAQLAMALAKAHEAGVIHRDLKPENVMVSPEGHVTIVDFGLAKVAVPISAPGKSPTHSAEGALLGTVGYMSPEQARGETADFRADQFAFGAILYELVTGTRAFQRSTSVDTLSMILNEPPAPPDTIDPTVPRALVWMIERCLSKDPAGRYASTRDLARDVETWRDRLPELVADAHRPSVPRRRSAVLATLALAAVAGAGAYAAYVRAAADNHDDQLSVQRLTFGRGHVTTARFGADGQTVFYSAGWSGAPVQVFERRLTGPESRAVSPPSTSLASISPTGELALLLGCRLDWGDCVGTLARMPQGGGAPREVMEDVVSADWGDDGQTLAAIQTAGGEYHVHYPLGKILYTTTSRIGSLRCAPDGRRLAFLEYKDVSAEAGHVRVLDLDGHVTTLPLEWEGVRDVAWAPDGGEILISGSEHARSKAIYGVSLSGGQRRIMEVPGALFIQDVARDGRVLVLEGAARALMVWSGPAQQHDRSWLDWSTAADLSADGRMILFYEWGDGVGGAPAVYLRPSDGADAIRLGEGRALALSPDSHWALALQESPAPHLVLLPTGAGQARSLPAGGLSDFYWAKWFPDGRRLLVVGEDAERVPGSYIQHLDTGRLEPIAAKGMLAVLVSPDGQRLLVNDPLEGYLIWPLDGAQATPLHGLEATDRPVQWSSDGRFLYVRDSDETLVRIRRFELATGRTDLLRELAPPDPSGVVGVATGRGELAITPDGRSAVFTYWTFVRDLFLLDRLPR